MAFLCQNINDSGALTLCLFMFIESRICAGNFVGQAFRPAYRKAKAFPYKKNNVQI